MPTTLFAYCLTLFMSNESLAQNIIIGIYFVFGALGGSIVFFLKLFDATKDIALGIAYGFRVVPLFCFCNGFSILSNQAAAFFADNPNAKVFTSIDVLSTTYIGMDLIYLGGLFVVFLLILLIKEFFNSSFAFGKFQENSPNYSGIDDEQVKKEIEKANQISKIDEESGNKEFSIRIKNLEKTYSSCFGENTHAIRNVSFCLDYGDCFALLGVNGAGKSSMFKCLTSEINPEKGHIYINGKSISSDFENIRHKIGYCPQIDAIIEELTVYENLEYFSAIKGIPDNHRDSIVSSIIKELNLSEFIDKPSGKLSGGNKRKLSVAIAMIGNPPIILLDEPSAGMDPEARRYMWSVIHSITKERKLSTVILTTHSMEEAETLCQKMGILVRGKFKCIGSSNVIKETYGKGFEIFLTLKTLSNEELNEQLSKIGCKEEDKIPGSNIQDMLNKMDSKLSVSLINSNNIGYNLYDDLNKHQSVFARNLIQWNYRTANLLNIIKGLLEKFPRVIIAEYWDNAFTLKLDKDDSITIGFLFGYLDKIKNDLAINEYSIGQTSLEQIFNSFANSDEYNNPVANHGKNHKPPIEVNSNFLDVNFLNK